MTQLPSASDLRVGAVVHVYRNLHVSGVTWSVRHRGIVVAHASRVALTSATFRVQPAGAVKARHEGTRNVHAYVAGVLAAHGDLPEGHWVAVTYRPFALPDAFERRDTGTTVHHADAVLFDTDGCWAYQSG